MASADLAVQGERLRDRVGAICGVDDVADNFQTMRVDNLAAPPGAQVLPLAVEHYDRRVLALEDVDAILRIRRHPADQHAGCPTSNLQKSRISS